MSVQKNKSSKIELGNDVHVTHRMEMYSCLFRGVTFIILTKLLLLRKFKPTEHWSQGHKEKETQIIFNYDKMFQLAHCSQKRVKRQ